MSLGSSLSLFAAGPSLASTWECRTLLSGHLTLRAIMRKSSGMTRKVTAAGLLVCVMVWAEMALAPMLAMHAGHMRPGHEMAADMAAEHAAHHAQPVEEMNHPCCPRAHKEKSDNALEFAAGAPPCSDPHSCCFRQGPQSVPTSAREPAGNDQLANALVPRALPQTDLAMEAPGLGMSDGAMALSPPFEVFGMTLRV